ncbi:MULTISPECIES: tautomerase family protein [unclassified Kribbella]|uniref:tautomerase family protein n=1 Tax=unclassified Kribbella TaxID=2644121 RepID=UPI0033D302C5
MPEVHVFMAVGRTDEQKKGMMRDITRALVDNLGCPIDVVTVQIIESEWTDKMKGGKTFAERYADSTPAGYQARVHDAGQ